MSEKELRDIKVIFYLLSQKGIGIAKINRIFAEESMFDDSGNMFGSLAESANETPVPLAFSKRKFQNIPWQYLSISQPDQYPSSLKKMLGNQTPPVLTAAGNIDLLKNRLIGFGGSRKASFKGLEITTECAFALASAGASIVSGYAAGIDLAAHKAALSAGGSTIIVLPNGMNSFYIRRELEELWDWDKILILSEFLPETPWSASNAMRRNSTIIGLSESMFIIEAGTTGGSLAAGMKTLEHRKKLIVPEFSNPEESATGNRLLLNAGAMPLRRDRRTLKPNLSSIIA